MYSLFNLGMLGLDERATAESLFCSIAGRAVRFSKTAKFVAEEFLEITKSPWTFENAEVRSSVNPSAK